MPHISIYPQDEIQGYLEELRNLILNEEIAKEKAKKVEKVRVASEIKKLTEDAKKYMFAEIRKPLKRNHASHEKLIQISEL